MSEYKTVKELEVYVDEEIYEDKENYAMKTLKTIKLEEARARKVLEAIVKSKEAFLEKHIEELETLEYNY